jgi:hypothetical protein
MIGRLRNQIMPVARDLFYSDPVLAMTFIESRAGVILHEEAHYVAANADGPVAGHLIVEDGDGASCSGAFAFDKAHLKRLGASAERCAFISAAGAVAEFHFCDRTNVRRLGPDIDSYCSLLSSVDRGLSVKTVVAWWQQNYLTRIEALAGCIESNFDLCMAFCRSDRFLLNGHHVIPSCVLEPPRRRSWFERMDEVVRTWPMGARMRALDGYLTSRGQI